jgi:peptidoglycan/LPS O-acetylase OafA/YrhL
MITRIKELDGLRGIAVVLVMASHIFRRANEFTQHPVLYSISNVAALGWVGVDIFFVLSGFLITSILFNAREKQHYFRNFYVRRILRIVPLYYIVMLVVFQIVIPIKTPEFVDKIPKLIPFQLLYLQNWVVLTPWAESSVYIGVTWSLAIEEQFYLFWPALIYFIKKESLFKWGLGYFLLSGIIRTAGILLWKDTFQAIHFFYYNSFTRFDELILGGLLAIVISSDHWQGKIKTIAQPMFFTSLFVFIAFSIIDQSPLNFRHIPINLVGYTSMSILTSALISIFVIRPENSLIRRIFRNGILTFLGKYSYAMYLFHIPVLLILLDLLWWTHYRGWKMYVLFIASSFLVTIVLSFASWHLFEKHMLNFKKYFEYE